MAPEVMPTLQVKTTQYNSLIGETEEGCYIDKPKRDLPYRLQAHGSAGNPRRCFELAQAAGYKYAGLQHGNECWAGNAVGKYGQTKDTDCNMPCGMDNTRNCGATWRNHVYRIPSKKEKGPAASTNTTDGDGQNVTVTQPAEGDQAVGAVSSTTDGAEGQAAEGAAAVPRLIAPAPLPTVQEPELTP